MHKKNNKNRSTKRTMRVKRISPTYKGGVPVTAVINQRALAPSLDICAVFTESGFLTSGTTTAARQWTPNSFFDCQPAVGGRKWNEYDQWSALYTSYRVLSYRYTFKLNNTEGAAYPIQYYILQTDANPGTTVANYLELSGQKYCKTGLLSFNPRTIRGKVSIDNLVGERSADYADDYKALMTADPADKVWLSLGCTFSNAVSINGLMFSLEIVAVIRLFAPNIVSQYLRPTALELEAQRRAYKLLKWSKLQKDNEKIDEDCRSQQKKIELMISDRVDEILAKRQ